MAAEAERSGRRALFILLIASLLLVGAVIRPLGIALFLAVVIAGVLWPTHNRLQRVLGGRQRLSAGVMVLAVLVGVLGPLLGLSAFVVKEASQGVAFVQQTLRSEGVEGFLQRLPDPMENLSREVLERLPEDGGGGLSAQLEEQVTARGGAAAAAVGGVVAATGSLLFQGVMMLIALYFLLVQKEAVLHWVDEASPLRRGQTRELLAEFRLVSVAVIRSSALTALVQALAAVIGYYIVRLPHPVFFGAVTFFVALIPAVGAASVCLTAALLLLLTGHPVGALFLALWGLLVVGLADNVVKPLLIKGGVQLHGAIIFFSLLGGLAAFGAVGLLIGPLAVALFIAIHRIYRRDYGDSTPGGPAPPKGRAASEVLSGGKPVQAT